MTPTLRAAVALLAVSAGYLVGAAPSSATAVIGAPSLTAPVATNVSGTPVLSWHAVANAARYRVQLSTSDSFSSTVYAVDTVGLDATPSATLPLGALYWRVAGIDASNQAGPFSDVAQFTETWDAAPNPVNPADDVTLHYPADPAVFSWQPLPGAQKYTVEVDDSNDFIGAQTLTTVNTSVTLAEPLTADASQAYYWRVQGVSGQIPSAWSETRSFHYDWNSAPQLLTPANTPLVPLGDVTFTWNAVAGARVYQLQVSPNADFSNNITIDTTVEGLAYAPPGSLLNGSYFWHVRAIDAAASPHYGTWSDTWQFTRGASGPPVPTSPSWDPNTPDAVPMVHNVPDLAWSPVDHASYYEVQLSTDANFSVPASTFHCYTTHTELTPYTSITSSGAPATCDTGMTSSLAAGLWYWRVRSVDMPKDVLGVWSNTDAGAYRFVIDRPGAGTRTSKDYLAASDYLTPDRCLLVESCTTIGDTPTFSWNPVVGAVIYKLTIAADKDFTNTVRVYTTTGTTLTPREALLDSQAGQAYYWYVQACYGGTMAVPTPCGPDATNSNYNVDAGAFRKRSAAVELAADAGTVGGQPLFTWNDYLATNQGLSPAVAAEAMQYRIQVSTVADFSTTLDTQVVDGTSYAPASATYPDGPLYWRVQAIDGSNNNLTWSPERLVTKQSLAPTPMYPADGSSQTLVPYLQWAPVPGVGKYTVEVYPATPGACATSGALTVTASPKFAAWSPTTGLAAGTYAWHVRALDADSRVGPWSTLRCFTLSASAPALQAPTPGAALGAQTALFTWTAVTGAAQYRWQLSTNGFTTTASTQTTTGLAWEPLAALPAGTLSWRVQALDGSGNVIGTSAARTFSHDTTPPTVTAKAPLTVLPLTGTLAATFSEPVKNVSTTTFRLLIAGTSTVIAGTVHLSGQTATFTPRSPLMPGASYTVQLTAGITDTVGNALVPVSWTVRADTLVENTSPAWREYWDHDTYRSAHGGGYDTSNTSGSSLRFTFTGTSATLLGMRSRSGGYANVSLDGGTATKVSCYASSTRWQQAIWTRSGLANTQHTVTVSVLGTKPSGATGAWVPVDALRVGSTYLEERSSAVHEAWRRIRASGASGGSYDVAIHATSGDTSTRPSVYVTFSGTRATVYATATTSAGRIAIYLDGIGKGTFSLRGPTQYRRAVYTATAGAGMHTLRVDVVGTASGAGSAVGLDYVQVG